MNYLNFGLIIRALLLLGPFVVQAADELPTTRLLPVITESAAGEPLSAEQRSVPFLTHLGDLNEFGYVEEEYEITGAGNIYDYVDNVAQSAEVAISEAGVPYVTRMLVRRPADPLDFNGTVYVEILNSTSTWDDDPIWRMSYPSFIRAGSAYVGITSDPLTVNFLLNRWGSPEFVAENRNRYPDPLPDDVGRNRERYQNLNMTRFGQVWDILSQSGALLKDADNPDNPMTGYNVERIIQTGYSQSANFQKTYGSSMHSRDIEEYGFPVYDGYYLGAGGFSSKRINPPPPGEGPDYWGFDDLRRLIDVDAPVIRFQTESEMLAFFAADTGRQVETGLPDSPKIRTYEMAGGVHVDLLLENTGLLIRERDMGFSPEPEACLASAIPISVSYIQSALLRSTEVWVRDGIEPTHSRLIQMGVDVLPNGREVKVVVFDEHGNATGGLRSPQIEVPLGTYVANPFTMGPACYLNGRFDPFDEATFRKLYPTDQDYLRAVDREISHALAEGFVLAADADSMREDMLADAGITDEDTGSETFGGDDDNFFGCALGSNGRPDPVFPALVFIAMVYLTRRKWLRPNR